MAQSNTVELAKKGDASAIATLMNKSLRSKGVAAEAVRKGNFLEITLHSQRALNQRAMLDIVQKGMKNLQVAAIERVLVRSQTGNTPTWESEFSLSENASIASPPAEINKPAPATEPEFSPQNPTLSAPVQAIQTPVPHVSSEQPSGMVLLPNFSQVNRSLQQYQDIIVRLTDDSGSQIICLCTLAELIQSLHMPNAQLQHIADAIAKCSNINADAERIIRNVSILQPGQAWQKTQIRCVLQVFFEMGIDLNITPETTGNDVETKQTMIEVDSQSDETQIEAVSPTKTPDIHDTVIETSEVIASAEETIIEVHRGTAGKADNADNTEIEAVSQGKVREYGVAQPINGFRSSQPVEQTSEPLFDEFTFSMMPPVRSVTEIDTISDPVFPQAPPETLSLTLEEFSRDLLAG
jgi:hypothetical protein